MQIAQMHLKRIQRLFPNIRKIVDADRPVVVEVEPRDAKEGAIKDPQDCAMARACKRAYGLDGVIISLSSAYLVKGETAIRYSVPSSLNREVVAFDRYKKFEPGLYSLSPINLSQRLGKKVHGKTTGAGSNRGTTKRLYHHTTGVRRFPDRAVGKGDLNG